MYSVTLEGTKELNNTLKKLGDTFGSKEMMEFLGKKCEQTLFKITHDNLSTVDDLETSEYARNHQKEIKGNKIILSNDTMADLSDLSPETLSNYPNGFSIAKAVEFGTGIIGASSEASGEATKFNWQYDINQHGNKGWYYKKNGNFYWSKGFEGRLIYYKTAKEIEQKCLKWVNDYISKKTKGV